MKGFELGIYVGLFMAVIFLLSGLSVLLFGKKIKTEGTNQSIMKFSINGHEMSMPYNINILICCIGAILLFMTFNLILGGDDSLAENENDNKSIYSMFNIISTAFAENNVEYLPAIPGWVYFGYEKNPTLWNFELINGDYNDLLANDNNLILKSKKIMNIRADSFGNFTGTFLNFINPAPKVIGNLQVGKCVRVKTHRSIGFSKIWVDSNPISCPK